MYNNVINCTFVHMYDFIPYYLTRTDSNNFTHSIDMIYLLGFGDCPDFKPLIQKYNLSFEEGSSNKKNKYTETYEYLNFDTIGLNKCMIVGYSNRTQFFDDDKEEWSFAGHHLLSAKYWVLRFNPNKIYQKEYWHDFLSVIVNWSLAFPDDLFIHKFDYSVDVPDIHTYDFIVNSKKTSGRLLDTYYFGKCGRNGYLKIYNKIKEYNDAHFDDKRDGVLSRVEYTFIAKDIYKFDDISFIDFSNTLDLLDTDIAILKMFQLLKSNNIEFDLKNNIGRRKYNKLKDAIFKTINVCDMGLLLALLSDYCELFHCQILFNEDIDYDLNLFFS